MTNREKFAEQILDIACNGDSIAVNKVTSEPMRCHGTACKECLFNFDNDEFCRDARRKWANMEYVEPSVDWSKVAVDTPILVKDRNDHEWLKRYFAKYENGSVYAWNTGSTSWSDDRCTAWELAKLPESTRIQGIKK